MENDDFQVGYLFTRREALALLVASGVLLLTRCSSTGRATTDTSSADSTGQGSCVVRPQLTEGPYFVDELLNRSDIRSDPLNGVYARGGSQLLLSITRDGEGYAAPFDIALQT
jgi:hypothetical protein